LEFLKNNFDFSLCEEVTIEINPENIYLLEKNINFFSKFPLRISAGIQSLDDKILSIAGRSYNSTFLGNFFKKLFLLKKGYNFKLNLDFISFGIETTSYFESFKKFI
jgi:coproporphyrinogen III oxidase-like Fe-S oxidoreductase